jgi:hypothetical protein
VRGLIYRREEDWMKGNSTWRNRDTWQCNNHLPVVRYPAGVLSCWYWGCKSKRPIEAKRPGPVERVVAVKPVPMAAPLVAAPSPAAAIASLEVCAWHECESERRKNSKYCSRECSNKNARARYRRKKSDPKKDRQAG